MARPGGEKPEKNDDTAVNLAQPEREMGRRIDRRMDRRMDDRPDHRTRRRVAPIPGRVGWNRSVRPHQRLFAWSTSAHEKTFAGSVAEKPPYWQIPFLRTD